MDEETVDRRRVLGRLAAAGAGYSLAGCSADQSALGGGSSGGQGQNGDAQGQNGDARPVTCDNSSASHIFTFGRDGFTIVLTDRSTANATVETLYSSPRVPARVGAEPYIDVREADGGFALRLKDTNASLSDLRAVLDDRSGVKTVRRGLPASKLEAEAKAAEDRLTSGGSDQSVASAQVVTPSGNEPPHVAVSLFDPPPRTLLALRSPETTELRVKSSSGERRVATGRDFEDDVVVRNGPDVGRFVGLVAKPAVRPELLSTLRQSNVLSEPNEHPLRIYSEETRLAEFTLSREFVTEMQSGEWSGQFVVPVDSLRAGRKVALALKPAYQGGTLVSCG